MPDERYEGEYTSALVRCRKLLRSAGFSLMKSHGRYTPMGGHESYTYGANVVRVGCSHWIALHARASRYASAEENKLLSKQALTVLRDAGLPFDDRGWLECRPIR